MRYRIKRFSSHAKKIGKRIDSIDSQLSSGTNLEDKDKLEKEKESYLGQGYIGYKEHRRRSKEAADNELKELNARKLGLPEGSKAEEDGQIRAFSKSDYEGLNSIQKKLLKYHRGVLAETADKSRRSISDSKVLNVNGY